MTSSAFASRRFWNTACLIAATVVATGAFWAYEGTLHAASYLTGWVLLAGTVVLTGFNLRKKFPFMPLLRSATWLQIHIYLGFFLVAVFVLHTGWRVPTGRFETVLWTVFWITALSGICGLVITRLTPIRQRDHGESVFRDRMSFFRAQLREEVESLVLETMTESQVRTLAKLYTTRLHYYFSAPRFLLQHLLGLRHGVNSLLSDMDAAVRYLDAPSQAALEKIREKVGQKDALDFHYAHLMLLRLWLFVHLPATYSLIILAFVHVALAYGFGMGTP